MAYTARPFVLHEATYRQLMILKPNVAILPWGAMEAHNYHLPHGTDNIEAATMAEMAAQRANEQGARCVVLPCVPFGNDNMQLDQIATITMTSATQHQVLRDVAMSLVRQGIDRMVLLNFHGGNEFKAMIRDVMLEYPIFIVQVHGYLVADWKPLLENTGADHADEFETSILLHLCPQWVDFAAAGEGKMTPYALKTLEQTPGAWAPRDWKALTKDTGAGDPRKATAEKGRKIWEMLVSALAPLLVELSKAQNGDFPYVVRQGSRHA